jgi:hypothetical protein
MYEELLWVTVTEVYQTLRVKTLFIYFYTNYFFLFLIRWLKCSEIYRATGAMGVVRGSFPL